MANHHPTNPPQHFPGENPAPPPTDKPPVRETGEDTAPSDRDVADPHPADEEDPYRERDGDRTPSSDRNGVNPSGLGPAQPLPDHDHDQTPATDDVETLTPSEHGDLSEAIERERDA